MTDLVKNLKLQFSNLLDFVLRDHQVTHSGIFKKFILGQVGP